MLWLTDPQTWTSLFVLTILEIVLGIDNIVFISILAGKLPAPQQAKARFCGLGLALITRILLLCSIFWLTRLTAELFRAVNHGFSGKDLVLIAGGLFLLWKGGWEIHESVEGEAHDAPPACPPGFAATVAQIILIDIVFSLDSVITAVGLAKRLGVMIAAVVLAVMVMMGASGVISAFIHRNPSIKMLALSFLLLIGVVLIADGFGEQIEKGYIYFAMAFSFVVELLNIRRKARRRAAAERKAG